MKFFGFASFPFSLLTRAGFGYLYFRDGLVFGSLYFAIALISLPFWIAFKVVLLVGYVALVVAHVRHQGRTITRLNTPLDYKGAPWVLKLKSNWKDLYEYFPVYRFYNLVCQPLLLFGVYLLSVWLLPSQNELHIYLLLVLIFDSLGTCFAFSKDQRKYGSLTRAQSQATINAQITEKIFKGHK